MRYCVLNPRSRQFEWASSPSGDRHRQGKLIHVGAGLERGYPKPEGMQPGAELRMFHIKVVKSRDRPRLYHFTTPTEASCKRWVQGLKVCIQIMAEESGRSNQKNR